MQNSQIIILFSLLAILMGQLKIDRVKIVDRNQARNNYLVRGNLPIDTNKRFQIKQLKAHLTNLTNLSDYKLIVISFLNFLTPKETRNRYIQQKYFEKHSNYRYKTELILGSLINPDSLPYRVAKSLLFVSPLFDIDQIDELISSLHSELQKGKNKIIYIHCSAGMDRTGYVAGSYKLKYLNYTLKKVLKENSKFGGERKIMHYPFLNGLKWFCLANKNRSACR